MTVRASVSKMMYSKRSDQMEDLMSKKNKKKIVVAHISSVEATLANKPYYVPSFRCGGHMTQKDRPRDKNWCKWL